MILTFGDRATPSCAIRVTLDVIRDSIKPSTIAIIDIIIGYPSMDGGEIKRQWIRVVHGRLRHQVDLGVGATADSVKSRAGPYSA